MNRRFQFQKSGQLFLRVHNEALSVAAVRVSNPGCSPSRIYGRDTALTPPGFAEIVGDEIAWHSRKGLVFPLITEVSWESSRLRRRLPDSYGSACQIVQRYNPGDLFLTREDRQPANASLPHELFSLFDVLVLEATNKV